MQRTELLLLIPIILEPIFLEPIFYSKKVQGLNILIDSKNINYLFLIEVIKSWEELLPYS